MRHHFLIAVPLVSMILLVPACAPRSAGLEARKEAATRFQRTTSLVSFDQAKQAFEAGELDKARKEVLNVTSRGTGAHIFAGEYFAEEVRRDIFERYGEKKLYEGGLSVRATLDPKMQVMARKAITSA